MCVLSVLDSAYNSGAQQRVIRLQEKPVDPFQPSKFKHTKLPPPPPDAPVPVMHSPPRKITAEDQAAWKIPPVIRFVHYHHILTYSLILYTVSFSLLLFLLCVARRFCH